jgi:glycosyltransferase involved in cell wall biosynthesis
MRITFLTLKIDLLAGGGANRGLDIKLRGLIERGHDVRLITIFPELNKLPPEGVPYTVENAPCASRSFFALQQHVVSLLKENESRTDVYHIDGVTFLWAGGMYRRAGGHIPTAAYLSTYTEALKLLTFETPDPKKGILPWIKFNVDVRMVWLKHLLWAKFVGMASARFLDVIFVPSPEAGVHYAQFGFQKDRIVTMPEFVDPSRFHPEAFQSEPYPVSFDPDRPFRLLHVGRLMRMKGIDLLIRALTELRRNGRIVTLSIIGDGPQLERLKKLAVDLGATESIIFVPWTDESGLADAYAASDAFVHPCRFPEPFGRTVLEALFFSRPVITSKGSGSEWAAGKAGVATRMGSAEDLELTLSKLYDNPNRLSALSNNAPERVEFYKVDRWLDILEDTFKRLNNKNKSV